MEKDLQLADSPITDKFNIPAIETAEDFNFFMLSFLNQQEISILVKDIIQRPLSMIVTFHETTLFSVMQFAAAHEGQMIYAELKNFDRYGQITKHRRYSMKMIGSPTNVLQQADKAVIKAIEFVIVNCDNFPVTYKPRVTTED